MFEKKCKAFFVEHMQRASVDPEISANTYNSALTLQSPSKYGAPTSLILKRTAKLRQSRYLFLQKNDIQGRHDR
jgi:hypothetical protein